MGSFDRKRGGGRRRKQMKITFKVTGLKTEKIENFTERIVNSLGKRGIKVSGIIRLPNKRLAIPTRRSPSGEGTESWDFYEMVIHRRLLEMKLSPNQIPLITAFRVPSDTYTEIRFVGS